MLFNVIISFGCKDRGSFEHYKKIDLAIENGMILDGSGDKAIVGNIYIDGDKIIYAGPEKANHPEIISTINAQGKYVTPGFIDLHAHGNPLKTPEFKNFLSMGVTTISLGQDGSSPAFENLKTWMDSVQQKGIGTNLAMMVGHGTIRNLSGIGMKKHGSDEEIEKMLSILDDNLKYCFGLSTGLEYNPGLHASSDELISLAKVIGSYDRIIMSHMRNEDDDQLASSINELIQQGKYCKVHIAHLKSVYGKGKERAEEILDIIHKAREDGIQLTADLYPYNASYTGISIVFPEWAKTPKQFEKAKTTRRQELEGYLRNKVLSRNGPQATLLGSAPYTGKTLKDLEEEFGKPFEKILIEDIGPQGSSGAYFVMNEELQSRLIKDPVISVCSDGSPTGYHPRGHGTFAKVIEKYVVQDRVLSLEEAVHKMTGYASEIMGLTDRGKIEKGMKADIIIFDPEEVKARADYTNPHQLAEGFDYVIVNGKIAKQENDFNSSLNGRVLTPSIAPNNTK